MAEEVMYLKGKNLLCPKCECPHCIVQTQSVLCEQGVEQVEGELEWGESEMFWEASEPSWDEPEFKCKSCGTMFDWEHGEVPTEAVGRTNVLVKIAEISSRESTGLGAAENQLAAVIVFCTRQLILSGYPGILGTKTGRWKCNKPNVANEPKEET